MQSVDRIVKDIQSGDLIFFTGTVFTSFVTQLADGGISHVGMAHRIGNDVYIMHSVSSHSMGGRNNFAGVQITNLRLMWNVQLYKRIDIYRLDLTIKQYEICKHEFLSFFGTPYDRNPIYSWLRQLRRKKSMNCIHLVKHLLESCKASKKDSSLRLSQLKTHGTFINTYRKPVSVNFLTVFTCQSNRDATADEIASGKTNARSLLGVTY